MKKSVKVEKLSDNVGIVVSRGNQALVFTKPGITNAELTKTYGSSLIYTIQQLHQNPTRKALRRNYADLLESAKQQENYSEFSLIRRAIVNRKKSA